MSGKREASYSIDPNTLQEKQKDQQIKVNSDNDGNKIQKVQRQIFKIKRPGQSSHCQTKQTKVNFKLNQSQQIKSTELPITDQKNIKEQKQQQKSSNPFENFFKPSDKNVFHGIGIFSNINSTNLFASNNTNIFTANKDTEQTSKTVANPGETSIFSNQKKNIFDNSIKNTTASLFSNKIQTNNDEDGSGDSAQLEQTQKLEANPQKSNAQFSYDDSCPVLLTLRVAKFKKNGGDLIQNLEIVLQKDKQSGLKYITVRLPATKKSIFAGILLDGKSQVKHLNGKKQNVQVSAFYKQKQAFTKAILKFQFQNQDDGEKLYERLNQLLKTNKHQEGAATQAKN